MIGHDIIKWFKELVKAIKDTVIPKPDNVVTIYTSNGNKVTLYKVSKEFEYNDVGNITAIYLYGIDQSGRSRKFKKSISYDNRGNIKLVSSWQEIS